MRIPTVVRTVAGECVAGAVLPAVGSLPKDGHHQVGAAPAVAGRQGRLRACPAERRCSVGSCAAARITALPSACCTTAPSCRGDCNTAETTVTPASPPPQQRRGRRPAGCRHAHHDGARGQRPQEVRPIPVRFGQQGRSGAFLPSAGRGWRRHHGAPQ